jgi:hypothetical protein
MQSISCQEKNALAMRFFRHFAKLRADQGMNIIGAKNAAAIVL